MRVKVVAQLDKSALIRRHLVTTASRSALSGRGSGFPIVLKRFGIQSAAVRLLNITLTCSGLLNTVSAGRDLWCDGVEADGSGRASYTLWLTDRRRGDHPPGVPCHCGRVLPLLSKPCASPARQQRESPCLRQDWSWMVLYGYTCTSIGSSGEGGWVGGGGGVCVWGGGGCVLCRVLLSGLLKALSYD